MITVPESVLFYRSDPANMAAVNVLAEVEDIPADLTLQEAERFALANLAAHRVRVEFWRFLRQLWTATWGKAVHAAFPSARLLTYGEHEAWGDEETRRRPRWSTLGKTGPPPECSNFPAERACSPTWALPMATVRSS